MPMRMASCEGPQVEGQVVLVLQGGGALGAYQLGVYQALHEAGVEPDWVIGTSIGAINGAIIAGNAFEERLPRKMVQNAPRVITGEERSGVVARQARRQRRRRRLEPHHDSRAAE